MTFRYKVARKFIIHKHTNTHTHTHVAATGKIRFVFGYKVIREFFPDLEQKSCGDEDM